MLSALSVIKLSVVPSVCILNAVKPNVTFVVKLSVILISVVMRSVFFLSIIMLSALNA